MICFCKQNVYLYYLIGDMCPVAAIIHICAFLVMGKHPAVSLSIHSLRAEGRREKVYLS